MPAFFCAKMNHSFDQGSIIRYFEKILLAEQALILKIRYLTAVICPVLILLFMCTGAANAEQEDRLRTNPSLTDTAGFETRIDGNDTPAVHETESTEAEKQPKPVEEAAAPQPVKKNPCAYYEVSGKSWLDQTHSFVERKLCEPAVWFDGFFGEDRVLEDIRPGSFVKWRNAARWTESNDIDYLADFTVRWRLPRLENWLQKAKLFLVSGSDEEEFNAQPGQAISPGIDPDSGTRTPVIGVQVDHAALLRSLISIDAGVKIRMPPDPYIRMRYQYSRPFLEVYLVRFIETALFSYAQHFRETSQLDLERKISTFTLLRWSNYATYVEGTPGVNWNSGISLITQLSPKSAISYDASTWGVNYPYWTIDNFRIGSRYRRNISRPWLFLELEPEVTWPKDVTGERKSLYAFSVTLEAQFGK